MTLCSACCALGASTGKADAPVLCGIGPLILPAKGVDQHADTSRRARETQALCPIARAPRRRSCALYPVWNLFLQLPGRYRHPWTRMVRGADRRLPLRDLRRMCRTLSAWCTALCIPLCRFVTPWLSEHRKGRRDDTPCHSGNRDGWPERSGGDPAPPAICDDHHD